MPRPMLALNKFTGKVMDTENKLMVDRRQGWVKNVKGLRSTNWQLQNSHGDVKYNLGSKSVIL